LFQKKDADKPLFGKARAAFSKNVAESKKTHKRQNSAAIRRCALAKLTANVPRD